MQDALAEYERAATWVEAEAALERLVSRGKPEGLDVGELFDEIATEASEEGDLKLAIRAQRKALRHGCRFPRLGREMLGWYLMKQGHVDEAEREFAALLEDGVDDDVDTLLTLCLARGDTGRTGEALEAADAALAVARRRGDDGELSQIRAERRALRRELGLAPDGDDRLAPRPRGIPTPGRNQPCWCGSGRKYKRCCGR